MSRDVIVSLDCGKLEGSLATPIDSLEDVKLDKTPLAQERKTRTGLT